MYTAEMYTTNAYYIGVLRLYSNNLFFQGESEGYTVKSKEKDIAISDYPLLQTEFLYESKKGTADTDFSLLRYTGETYSVGKRL